MTGRITIDLFTTLDGVSQGPGGPDEDTSGGFAFGGWQAPLMDELVGRTVSEGIDTMDALVLGRRTYDIFASYWPQHVEGDGDGVIGRKFDAIAKYVATRGDLTPGWQGTSVLEGDAAASVSTLREKHADIHVIGSIDFAHSLLAAEAYDELRLWMYPLVLGQGKKVFPDGAVPARLRLIAPAETGDSGVVLLRYAPDGAPQTGDMTTREGA